MNTMIMGVLCLLFVLTSCVAFKLQPQPGLCNFPIGKCITPPAKSKSTLTSLRANHKTLEDIIYNPPDYLLRLVERFPGRRLSVSDVVAGSGKTFYAAKRDLLALASLTHATLEVTNEGELFFIFPYGVSSLVQRKSVTRQMQVIYNKTSPIALNVLKASFGVMLGISLVVVFVGLAMLQSNGEIDSDSHSTRDSNSDSNNKKSSKHNRRYKPSNRIEFSLTDYFFIEDLTRIFLHPGSTSPPPSQQPLNFLEACYSFLFGDGDANQGYGIALIIQAAQYIRANNGLVVAEELAPFVFNPPALPSNTSKEAGGGVFEEGDIVRVDESYLLPLVLQLNGNPIVTENGHILYYFEELMKSPNLPNSYLTYPSLRPSILTPASTALDNRVSLVPLEVVPKFSRARSTQLAKVGLLGVANLVGVAALGESLVVAKGKVRKAGELVGFLKMVYPPLTIYALGFVCLPLVRYIYHVGWEKGRIQGRNEKRTQWVQQLQGTPTSSLREKLVDKVRWLTSKKQASSVVEGHGEVVFSTLNSQALKDDKMEEKKLETLR